MLTREEMRAKIFLTLLAKFPSDPSQRHEALRDYFLVTLPGMTVEMASQLASLVPSIMPKLYERWISLFAERLFATIPEPQLQVFLSGGQENDAALALVFLMFLESARMEEQMEKDLREYAAAHAHDPDMGNAVAAYLRAKVEDLARTVRAPVH